MQSWQHIPNDLVARIHKHLRASAGISPMLRKYYVIAVERCAHNEGATEVFTTGSVSSPLFYAQAAVGDARLWPFVEELRRRLHPKDGGSRADRPMFSGFVREESGGR